MKAHFVAFPLAFLLTLISLSVLALSGRGSSIPATPLPHIAAVSVAPDVPLTVVNFPVVKVTASVHDR